MNKKTALLIADTALRMGVSKRALRNKWNRTPRAERNSARKQMCFYCASQVLIDPSQMNQQ